MDHHCHLLPGIDDGAGSAEESLAMAGELWAAGYGRVHCTPHWLRGSYDNSPAQVRRLVAELQSDLDAAGIPLRVSGGMEYYLDEFFLELQEFLPLGDSRRILVEAPSRAHGGVVLAGLQKVLSAGYVPLVAHPERSEVFSADREKGVWRVDGQDLPPGVQAQGNLGSFLGAYGQHVQRRAYDLLRMGTYCCLGSDGHDLAGLRNLLTDFRAKFLANPALCHLAGLESPAFGLAAGD